METIASVECIGEFDDEYVYDLEVEGSHTFLANDIIVHNTDSIFVAVGDGSNEEAVEKAKKLTLLINAEITAEILAATKIQPSLEMEFDKMFASVLFVGVKKKYAGLIVYKDGKVVAPKLSVTGFEIIKKDTPPIAKRLLSEAFIKILNFERLQRVEDWLQKEVSKLQLSINDECCLNLEMSRGYKDYANLPMHVRAAEYSQANFGIKFEPGDKVNVMYVKKCPKGVPKTDIVAYKDDPSALKGFTIDRDTWVEKSIYRKLLPVFEALGKNDFNLDPSQTRMTLWA